jgi:hypothetical protein
MAAVIDTLIEDVESFELVRDKIATILKEEQLEQQVLAAAAGQPNPTDWALRVFNESATPIADWEEAPSSAVPIVNITFESLTVDANAGDTIGRQQCEATYNIDCYGYGVASDDGGSGQIQGDSAAAFACARAVRLVRKILMAGHYVSLGMTGVVGRRWISTITAFQPAFEDRAMQQVVAARIQFQVRMTDATPQVTAQYLREIGVTVLRAETGEIYLQGEYPHDS